MQNEYRWWVLADSVRGASHVRSGKENQDSHKVFPGEAERRNRATADNIVAVSDGHGGTRYVRSHVGSRIAVESCVNVLQPLLGQGISARDIRQGRGGEVARDIVTAWLGRVREDLNERPLEKSELEAFGGGTEPKADETAYGATLMAAVTTARYLFFLQIGDGDILLLGEDGTVRAAVPEDPDQLANETHSLCMRDAWQYCRWSVIGLESEPPPTLIMMSTDGISNCFSKRTDFESVPGELLDEVTSRGGLESLSARLGGILNDWSRRGSGDDMTLAILTRRSGAEAVSQELLERIENTQDAAESAGNQASEAIRRCDETAGDLSKFREDTGRRLESTERLIEETRQSHTTLVDGISQSQDSASRAMDVAQKGLQAAGALSAPLSEMRAAHERASAALDEHLGRVEGMSKEGQAALARAMQDLRQQLAGLIRSVWVALVLLIILILVGRRH